MLGVGKEKNSNNCLTFDFFYCRGNFKTIHNSPQYSDFNWLLDWKLSAYFNLIFTKIPKQMIAKQKKIHSFSQLQSLSEVSRAKWTIMWKTKKKLSFYWTRKCCQHNNLAQHVNVFFVCQGCIPDFDHNCRCFARCIYIHELIFFYIWIFGLLWSHEEKILNFCLILEQQTTLIFMSNLNGWF